jgi:translocation and assembly module TamB
MKRIIVYGLLTLILGSVLAVWAAGTWLLESPDGFRWLLREVSRRTTVKIDARYVTGGIGKTLRMEGVTVRWPHGEAEVQELRLRCRPLWLPFGKLAVQELSLRGVSIQDNEPDSGKPPDLTWPQLPGTPDWLDAWIDRLQVDGLSYRRLETPPVTVTGISAALTWRHAVLTATNLTVTTPEGRATGAVTAGFEHPALTAALSVIPAKPVSGYSRLDLRARLLRGTAPEQLAGTVSLTALAGPRKSLELAGDVGMTRNAINLRGLEVTRPERRGTVRGEGTVLLTATEPRIRLGLRVAGLDLSPETGMTTDLSGALSVEGTATRYAGRFDLNNTGNAWRTTRLTGSFSGDDGGMSFTGLDGSLVGGTVRGELQLGWSDGFSVAGTLRASNLDPARVTPDWDGVVNLDLQGSVRWSGTAPVRAEVTGRLRESRLRGQSLTGEIAARTADGTLQVDRLLLVGKGFDIHADGDLARRLNVTAKITDLSGLVPHTAGKLDLQGWVRHAAGRTAGSVTGHGRDLSGDGVRVASAELAARLDAGRGSPVDVTARLKGVTYDHLHADTASLKVHGTLDRHTLEVALSSAGAGINAAASGGYGEKTWQGEVTALSGTDRTGPWKLTASARLTLSPQAVTLSPLVITGVRTERLELVSRIFRAPLRGSLQAVWHDLDLSRADQWLTDMKLSGRSSGNLRLDSPTGERLNLAAHVTAAGMVAMADRTVTIRQASLDLEADEAGIRSALDFGTAEGIRVAGRFTSTLPASLGIPERGELSATWEGVDLTLLQPHLPPGLDLSGTLSGAIAGRLLPGKRLDLTGNATLAGGTVLWRSEGRQISARVKKGDLTWAWRGEALSGAASLALAEHGEATADFAIPLPARLDTFLDPEGPVTGTLKGQFHEKGMLMALFPGLLQESRGEVEADLRVDGTWKDPRVTGRLELSRAGAYLPTAGITLKDIQLSAHLDRDQITVDSFKVTSGPGSLSGNAVVRLAGNRVTGYRGSVKGEKFQIVRLPDLQVLASPDATFDGTPGKMAVRGVVRVPELIAKERDRTTAVQPSSDVVVDRGTGPVARQPGMALDIQLKAVLGDRVFVKAAGFDGKLEGSVDLVIHGRDSMKGTGEIKVAKGRYSAYGATLDIKRGRVIFAGGPVEQPTLNILALREIGEVKAGFTVRGTPAVPVVKLYSEPAMPDVDILSYIVLGRKLNNGEEKTSLLMNAASYLASTGQSVYLQEQIKQRVGIDTFEVTTAKQQATDYRKIEPGLFDQTGKTSSSSISDSMLQVGKYLTPQLYFSYGWSLFSDSHVFRVRYNITKQWEIETRTGTDATGADIFYRIEFE